jgi:NAD-dependent dihydropyrimidine dehydrogenase PreA subunit
MRIVIDYDKCCWKDGSCVSCGCSGGSKGCEGCVEACPVDALERKKILEINEDLCINCGACVVACEKGAIKMEE